MRSCERSKSCAWQNKKFNTAQNESRQGRKEGNGAAVECEPAALFALVVLLRVAEKGVPDNGFEFCRCFLHLVLVPFDRVPMVGIEMGLPFLAISVRRFADINYWLA